MKLGKLTRELRYSTAETGSAPSETGETPSHLPTHRRVVAAASRQDCRADGRQVRVTQTQGVLDLLLCASRQDDRVGVAEQ